MVCPMNKASWLWIPFSFHSMYQPRIRASNCSSDRTYLQHPTLPLMFHPTAPDGVEVSDTIYSINASLLSLLSLLLLPSLFLPFNPKTQNQTPHLPFPLPLFFARHHISPHCATTTSSAGRSPRTRVLSTFRTTSMPSVTRPKTTCLLFRNGVATVQMKNWEPLVLGPEFCYFGE